MNYIEHVRQFHKTFNHPIGEDSKSVEDLKTRQLRIRLLFEELCELADASDVRRTLSDICWKYCWQGNKQIDPEKTSAQTIEELSKIVDGGNEVNKIEQLDALCDLMYVLCGTILSSGLHQVFDENFRRVHENNMNKAHESKEHAEQTINQVLKGEGKCFECEGRWIVHNIDGKTIKPWDFKKVELTL